MLMQPEDRVDWDQPFDALVEKIISWGEGAILALPNLLAATLVVAVAWLVSRGVRAALARGLHRSGAPEQIQRLLAGAVGFAVIAAGFFIALGILELDKALASLLAGAGILGLALGFAFQDIAANFIAGIFLAVRRPFRADDLIETNGHFGIVERIELRTTLMRTVTGQLLMIPNKEIFTNALLNYTITGERRVDLSVGVSYGDDLEKAERVAIQAVETVSSRDTDRPVQLFYEGFGDSSINFTIRFWLRSSAQRDFLDARSRAVKAIKKSFDENDITIPFPIRTLDFGIVGGEKLSAMLPAGMAAGPGGNGPRAQS